ncbi:MAG: transposase [Candidatus Zixiibacteriota bacterium]
MPYSDLLRGRISLHGTFYHISTVSLERTPRFSDFKLSRIVIKELMRLDEQELSLTYAWVLMPDHLHWIFQLTGAKSLSEIVRLLKGRSARRINQFAQSRGSIWEPGYYDHGIRETEDLRGSAEYLINNPVRDGIVGELGDYPFWDASWLYDQ